MRPRPAHEPDDHVHGCRGGGHEQETLARLLGRADVRVAVEPGGDAPREEHREPAEDRGPEPAQGVELRGEQVPFRVLVSPEPASSGDRKSTRLNSSHGYISYA